MVSLPYVTPHRFQNEASLIVIGHYGGGFVRGSTIEADREAVVHVLE